MNDTMELFSRLLALASYFEGGKTGFSAEKVFSPRAILAAGRGAQQTERIVAKNAPEGKAQRLAPLEQAHLLQQSFDRPLPDRHRPREGGNMSWVATGGEEALRDTAEAQEEAAPFMAMGGAGARQTLSADELSRAFARDARRYDE